MPNPHDDDPIAARGRLKQLEDDPKHTSHPDPKAIEQTRQGAVDDPKHQGKPDLDPHWHQDGDNWDAPGMDEEG